MVVVGWRSVLVFSLCCLINTVALPDDLESKATGNRLYGLLLRLHVSGPPGQSHGVNERSDYNIKDNCDPLKP